MDSLSSVQSALAVYISGTYIAWPPFNVPAEALCSELPFIMQASAPWPPVLEKSEKSKLESHGEHPAPVSVPSV